jgi:hypothetical protein
MIRLFQVFFPTSIIGLFLTETLLIAACYFGAYDAVSRLLMPGYDLAEMYYLYDNGLVRTLIPILTIQFGLYLSDLYSRIQVHSKLLLFQEFSLVVGIAVTDHQETSFFEPHSAGRLAACWSLSRR